MPVIPPPSSRRPAYRLAITACLLLIGLIAAASVWAILSFGGTDSPWVTLAILVAPAQLVFLAFIVYGYVSELRHEK